MDLLVQVQNVKKFLIYYIFFFDFICCSSRHFNAIQSLKGYTKTMEIWSQNNSYLCHFFLNLSKMMIYWQHHWFWLQQNCQYSVRFIGMNKLFKTSAKIENIYIFLLDFRKWLNLIFATHCILIIFICRLWPNLWNNV